MYRTKSLRIDVTLKPDALGRRAITLEPVFGDVIYIDTSRSTVSNYSNIWIGVDDEVMVNAAYSPVLDVKPAFFRKINIAWAQAEDNNVLSLIIGREASLRLQPPQYMALAQDLAGLAKDATLQSLMSRLVATDYDLITLDLGTARTDSLVAQNVIAFCIADASPGSTYSIKLFSTAKTAIDQSIAGKGFCLERLARASIYVTNTAQSGSYLKLLVLMW